MIETTATTEPVTYRPARKADSRTIAELFRICSGGVADYIWQKLAEPGDTLLDVGARRYARENTAFSYQSCTIAERGGKIAGMLHGYPIEQNPEGSGDGPIDPVLRPYTELEIPGSLYISGVAIFPEHRNSGIGSRFLALARDQARAQGLESLSALVFEGNAGSLRLFRRNGFTVIDRRQVVPHEAIEYEGEILLFSGRV